MVIHKHINDLHLHQKYQEIWVSKPDNFYWRYIQILFCNVGQHYDKPADGQRYVLHIGCQLSTEGKYMAPYGLSFSPRFCFAKITNIYYITKEAWLNISHYWFWNPCNHLLHPHSLDFYQETKTKKDLQISFWARKVNIPNNNFGWWRGRRR